MFLSGGFSVKKNIIVDKGFSEDYMSKKGCLFNSVYINWPVSLLWYYSELDQIRDQQCGSLSEKDLRIGRHNNIEKEEEDGKNLMKAMEIEDSEEDEGSLKDEVDYSFRKNPNSKWPNNRIPFELG